MKEHKHDFKFKGINMAVPGLNVQGKMNTGKCYACYCGAIMFKGDEK